MHRTSIPAFLLLLLLLLFSSCADGPPARTARVRAPSRARLMVGPVPVEARLAMTHEARARGLAGVQALPPDEGMLFVYSEPARRRFWMQGCLIALDIAFLDTHGRVLHVDTVQPPASRDAQPAQTRGSAPSTYVLEVPAGFFARHGLGAGTVVQIPDTVRTSDAQ